MSSFAQKLFIPLGVILGFSLMAPSPSLARKRSIVRQPDLVVMSISQSPSAPLAGQSVIFSAVVKNIGTAATGDGVTLGVSFLVNDQPVTWGADSSSPLAAGATRTITARGGTNGASWNAIVGRHKITAFIDDVNRIVESNELNNKLNAELSVASVSPPAPSPSPSASPSPTPTPTPSPSPVTGTETDLTIAQAISDMGLPSEALPINPGFNWMYKAVITQHSPAGSSIASWWTGERPTWCYGLLSWFTMFEAQGNTATNTRVEVKNLRVYILSQSTRTWSRWDFVVAPNTDTWTYPFNFVGKPDRKIESDGGVSFKPVYPNFLHGYGASNYPARALPNPADVRAVFTAIDMRLVVADPTRPDDRANAKYVVDSGADYYPDGTYVMWSKGYAPGVGNGRYLVATPRWRSATLVVPNTNYGATLEEIRLNPPPLK